MTLRRLIVAAALCASAGLTTLDGGFVRDQILEPVATCCTE